MNRRRTLLLLSAALAFAVLPLQEVMGPTGNGNVVMTFFFPEMFE